MYTTIQAGCTMTLSDPLEHLISEAAHPFRGSPADLDPLVEQAAETASSLLDHLDKPGRTGKAVVPLDPSTLWQDTAHTGVDMPEIYPFGL